MAYDVTSNRRRRHLAKLLEQYGVRVQKSAFEARLTVRERETLVRAAERIIDTDCDRFTIYPVAKPQERGVVHLGPARPAVSNPDYYLI